MPDLLLIASIAFALSQLLLSALLLLDSPHWSIQRRLYGLLLLAILAYLLAPLTHGSPWREALSALQAAVPGMFWLFSSSLFDDHFRLRRWQIILVAITVLLPLLGKFFDTTPDGLSYLIFYVLPQGLEFVLLVLTLVVVARYWRVDLIESRRRLRLWFCGLNGLYIFVLILFREILFADADWLPSLQYLPLGLMLLVTNAILLGYKQGLLEPSASPVIMAPTGSSVLVTETEQASPKEQKPPAVADVAPELVTALQALVETEGAYREMSLTIGQLANRLDIPEYRLRQTINAGLGYRNFNDFLNSYRIKEAAERLADPQQKDLPVLTIAMDTGFRSLSSFNKAFKETYSATPTAFRRQHLNTP